MWLQNQKKGEKDITSKLINILLIEDNAGDIRLIREMLKDVSNLSFKLEASLLLYKALKILKSRKFDVILLDLNLPDSIGIETVSKTLEVAGDTPVIILTSLNEEDLAISTVKMGVQDYLVKEQLNNILLVRSVKYAIERKKSEQKLKENTEFTQNIFNAIQDGLSVLDLDLNIIKVNPYTIEMYGSIDQILNRKCYDVYQKRSSPCSWCPSIKTIETGQLNMSTVPYPSIENPTGWIELTTYPLKNSDGIIEYIIEHIKDITERKIAEQKLIESEAKHRDLLETAAMGLMEINLVSNELTYVNPKLLEVIGHGKGALNKEIFAHKIIHFEDFEKVFEFTEEKELEFRIYAEDRNVKWLSGIRNNIYNDEGELIKMRLWLKDITERKEIEEIKSDLLTRFSHEFKTPLISIKGFADLLLDTHKDKFDKKALSFLRNIKDGSERLKTLVNTFIESSHLDKDFSKLELSNENLLDFIKTVIREVKGLADLRNHIIQINIPENLIVEIDREKIYTVITNIIINAIKYTPRGGLIAIKSNIEGVFISISVIDSGIGFTSSEKEKLFKKFGKIERYGCGWDIITDGIGMGLYISKKLINQHGGKIWVESQGKNKGSTFTITIPIRKNEVNIINT